MYKVWLLKKAQSFYDDCPASLAKKLNRCFTELELDPRNHPNIKMLTGELSEYRRYRVGDYRVIYWIDEKKQFVVVEKIAHRGEVYKN